MQGMVMLTASAWVPGLTPGPEDGTAKWWQGAMLFGALYIVALGTGGMPVWVKHIMLKSVRVLFMGQQPSASCLCQCALPLRVFLALCGNLQTAWHSKL